MTKRVYNFSAGPATLPLSVLETIQRDFVTMPEVGMSVIEMSHRSSGFMELIERAEANLRTLYDIPKYYQVLFLQGGASLQFSMLAMNFLHKQSADYILTGSWANKAIKEARREGQINTAWDGSDEQYVRVPTQAELQLDPNAAYVHMTSNETIQGVQFQQAPDTGDVPLICDMSSDFVSKPIELARYAMLYAGAQKNAGGAGVTMVVIRDDLLERVPKDMHAMLDYRLLAEKRSLYNTPPSFAIYSVMLVSEWLLNEVGGLAQINLKNQQKAQLLYEVIDESEGFYRGHAATDSRSLMNVTWRLADTSLEGSFIEQAKAYDLIELKGHRSVGGIRASIYNAMPLEGVRILRDFMINFQKQYG